MRHHLLAAATAAVLGLSFAGTASAQSSIGFRPIQQPVWGPGGQPVLLSPYLNLIRGGDPSANFFLGTLAEFQRRQNAYDFRSALDDINVRNRIAGEELPRTRGPIPSGTYSLVNNTGGYFNNTFNYYGNGARPPAHTIRPGTYVPPPPAAGSPARYGASPGFPPNPSLPPR
jgi:hypothetical protein